MTLSRVAEPLDRASERRSHPDGTGSFPAAAPAAVARAQLDALTSVVEDLAGQFELRPLLERILGHAAGLLGCRSGSICTVDERTGTYRKEVDLGVACRSGDQFPLTEGVTGEIVRAGGPVTFREYAQVRGGHISPVERAHLHATIGVPIRWADSVIGTCIVFSNDPAREFGAADVTLLELFAGNAGLAIVNARMHAQAAELARAEATGLERERIVRDVHDSVARALASVVLHLNSATERRDGAWVDGGDPLLATQLDLAHQAARTALAETRRIVLGVRPALPQATVEQAIQTQLAWARTSGLDVRLVVAGPPQALPPEITDGLTDLAHQAIEAIVAHSDARTARLGLLYGASEVVLMIEDDGVGFDLDQLPPDGPPGRSGPRLRQLVDRAQRLGGTVEIAATPGWGTTVRATIPYLPTAVEPPPRSTVLLVGHRPVVRAGVLALLAGSAAEVQVVGEIVDAAGVVEAYQLLQPDVVLIDVMLPTDPIAPIRMLRSGHPHAAVVAVVDTGVSDARIRGMVQAGVRAVVASDADGTALARAIAAAARGEVLFADDLLHGLDAEAAVGDHPGRLTARELEVRELVSRGLPDKQIADRLHISVKTVEKHVGSALRKTGARNRTELAGMEMGRRAVPRGAR